MERSVKGLILFNCVLLAVFCFAPRLAAQDKAQAKGERVLRQEIKKISGEVSSVNKDFISIVYKRDPDNGVDYEILLPLDENMQLKYLDDLKKLKEGDRISISYEETTVELEGRREDRRKAKQITFIGPAKQKPQPVRMEVPPGE